MSKSSQAPMLFGKRMRELGDVVWTSEPIDGLGHIVIHENRSGKYTASAGHRGFSPYLVHIEADEPQQAADQSEEFLRRIHTAIGKVIGS